MPKQKPSNKKTIQHFSNPPNKLSLFNNNISGIISKFEKSQTPQTESDTAIVPISNCAKLKISTKNNRIYGNSQNRNLIKSKQSSLVVNKYKMCESIDSGVINGDLYDNNNHSETIIENDEQFDESKLFDETDNDPNDFEFVPINGGGVKSKTPSKFMRLKNINLVRYQLNFFQRFVGIFLSFPFFSSINGAGLSTLTCAFFLPRILCENILYPIFRLILGTLYPAYASYKAVRNKDVKDYLKWIMYWIVFAFFTCFETFTDIFLSWFPFYYELKVVIVIWLLSPVTEGSSVLYRNFVHPMLTKREKEIDEYINQAKEKGCSAVIQLGSKGVNYATNVIMQTALKGGGNLVSTLRKSYSLSDLSEPDMHRGQDEVDEIIYGRSNQVIQYRQMPPSTQRYIKTRMQNQNMIHSNGMNRSSSTNRTVDVYNEDGMSRSSNNYDYIRSSEDISSGYSSTEANSMALGRTASLSNGTRYRPKTRRNEFRRSNDRIVEVDDDDYDNDAVAVTNNSNDLDMKYELFRKWLNANESNQINLTRNQKPILDHQTSQNMLLTEDEVSSFTTNESNSESDIFLDTETDYPSIILSEFNGNTSPNPNFNIAHLTDDAIHTLRADTPSQLSVSDFDCSSSDVTFNSRTCLTPDSQTRRKAKHKKGPAPPIPTMAQCSNEIENLNITTDTEHTILVSDDQTISTHTKSHIETDI